MENDDILGDNTDSQDNESGRVHAEFCKIQYEETQNPLYVWSAIEFLKADGREYPNWIKKYLTETAIKLLKIQKPDKDAPFLIKDALGIDNAHNFSEIHRSGENDYIYDPMCGSGTTAEAAHKLNRKCVVNDVNTDVVAIIKSRF